MRPLIRAVIDSHALRHNLRVIRARAAGARVIAVVKANAYGHGLVSTALALGDADALAVARLEEALSLRAAGIGARILLLEGVFSPAELAEAVHEGLDLVVHDASQIDLLERAAAARCSLWLKIDTGMNRLGFAPREFPAALARIRNLTPAPHALRLLTHLACANERDDQVTRAQLERFRAATHRLDFEVSIANS
ncbi:MAG TPA: alanine racemase, partial [Steroidobacteraceae bacterium]